MTEERQQAQEDQPSIQARLNDLEGEVRSLRLTLESRVDQPLRQQEAARAARLGILQLEEAILDILLEGMQENRTVAPSEITRRTGLPGGGGDAQEDWTAWSFLQVLVGENRAMHAGQGRYALTQAELALRRQRRAGSSPESTAHLGLRQVEEAILDRLQHGVPTADITHQLQLPVNASHFLRMLAAQNRVTPGEYAVAQPTAAAQPAEAGETDRD